MNSELPDDVWREVLAFFPYKCLLNISQTSKYFQQLASSFLDSACTEYILSDLFHTNTTQIISLLKDPKNYLVHWCMLSDSSPIWKVKLKNARHALESINFEIRNFLLSEVYTEMVNTWKSQKSQTEEPKRQRTCCVKYNCIKNRYQPKCVHIILQSF